MKTKRVLVTGASGFVGRQLVPALLHSGYAVRAVTHSQVSFPDSIEVTTVPDFKNSIDWTPILRGVDIIVHVAGLAHSSPEIGDSAFDQVNRVATQQLAGAAKGAGIERFVYLSSVRAQVAAHTPQTVREHDEPSPTNRYGRSKLAAEQAISAAGVPFTIFRPVVIYGPHPKGNMRTILRLVRSSWPLPAFSSRRSLLAIENLIGAVLFALDNPATIGEIYLVADSDPMTMTEIFAMLRKIQGRSSKTIHIPYVIVRLILILIGRTQLWTRLNGNLIVDTSKLRSVGWRPNVDTYEGLRGMMHAENDEELD